MKKHKIDFQSVTETSNSLVSNEQILRMVNRYEWASSFSDSKDVIEIACGTAQGLNLIKPIAKSIKACDISKEMIELAKITYSADSIEFSVSDGHELPFPDNSADIVILFEAIYYFKDTGKLIDEIKRVLRVEGELLISTANCDLYDFNPSPYSYHYYGASELFVLLNESNFDVHLFADSDLRGMSLVQKLFRFVKFIAVKLNLMPKTMKGKKIFKKIVFGDLVEMPTKLQKLNLAGFDKIPPKNNYNYKVILSRAILRPTV